MTPPSQNQEDGTHSPLPVLPSLPLAICRPAAWLPGCGRQTAHRRIAGDSPARFDPYSLSASGSMCCLLSSPAARASLRVPASRLTEMLAVQVPPKICEPR
jgi:hypothetical protein